MPLPLTPYLDSGFTHRVYTNFGKRTSASKIRARATALTLINEASENQITLGEIVVDEKSNEITAIPEPLDVVDVEGAVVTIDAIGTQIKIAEKIIEKQADYCLALKRNHSDLHDDVKFYFENQTAPNRVKTTEKGHGRIEKREYFLETDIDWLTQQDAWKGLAAIGAVRSTVLENEQIRIETRYFLTSLTSVERFADSVRRHWSIENQLHWQLDVTFGEDDARMRKDNSPLNWNVMRKTALPLLRSADIGRKTSLKRKMFIAALDVSVLEFILFC